MRTTMRAAREAARLTQADVAKALKVTSGAVSQWETGEATPTAARLVALAALLGVSAGALLAEEAA